MRRSTLITELLSVSELNSHPRPQAGRPFRICIPRVLLIGALLLTCGCQSGNSLTRFFKKSPPEDLSSEQKKSVLAILDGDKVNNNEAGLPAPSKSKTKNGDSLTQLLDNGQAALSEYYKDANPAHLTEAHRNYEQALAIESGNAESHHGLAIVCDLQKDYSSAELHYRAALEQDPDNGKVLGDLGYSYLLQGKFSESENTLVRATKLDPSNTQAVKNLAYIYAKQGDYNLADSTYRRVLNEVEVRQEMARLFPQGRPDMAKGGEPAKRPWSQNQGLTTEEFKTRMDYAREQSMAEMRDRKSALDAASSPALTIEQQQLEIAKLQRELEAAHKMADARRERSANSPLYLDDGQSLANTAPSPNTPAQPPAYRSGRRVENTFYPDGATPQGGQNRNGIEQVGGQNSHQGPHGQQPNVPALHETDRGVDPRTGMPFNSGIQQTEGQSSGASPNGGFASNNGVGPGGMGNPNHSPKDASFEEAKRRAAMAGMGGPEMMFNVPVIAVPSIDGGNRLSPGTGSTWNGGQYPQTQRMLPMDAAPHDLNQLMQAPSGQMTVEPNNMGMLNSPTGRSFSNPNFQQPLNPQISLDSPMGNAGLNNQEQSSPSQYQSQPSQPEGYQSDEAYHRLQVNPGPSADPRNRVNSELQQYGQSMQYNSAEQNSNAWGQVQTPANGVPNQPVVPNPNQMLTPSWNQKQLTPQFTPPAYPGRPSQFAEEQPSAPVEYRRGAGDQSSGDAAQGSYPSGASYNEPAAIYSSGVRVPAEYGSSNRATNTYGQSFDGPRITPAGR